MKRRIKGIYNRPGLAPGTLHDRANESGTTCQISVVDYSADMLEVRESAGIDDIAPAQDGIMRWIRIRGTPASDVLRRIGTAFQAHSLILEDINTPGQRVKVEDYDNLMFTVLRLPRNGTSADRDDDDLSILLTRTTIITVYETTDADLFAPIVARLENPESLLRHRRIDFLYHAIVDLVVDYFFPIVERIEDEATEVEGAILADASERDLRRIHGLRGMSQHLRSNLWSTRDVISRIERSTHRFIEPDTLFYFRDIHDHVVHLLDAISTLRDTANALMELYMSGVSNRMNEVMKVLTIISTVFIPITFIAGVYGMNFTHMPELTVRWAYPVVIGVMLIVAGGMLAFFRRKRWL